MDTNVVLDRWDRIDSPCDECVLISLRVDPEFPLAVDAADDSFTVRMDYDPRRGADLNGARKRPGARPLCDAIFDPDLPHAAPADVAVCRSGRVGKPNLVDRSGNHSCA